MGWGQAHTAPRTVIDEARRSHEDLRRQRAAELADAVRTYLAKPTTGNRERMEGALAASDRAAAW